MVRVTVGLAAWIAGTASAVCVAWLGANVVVRNAGVGPGIPVINATVVPSATATTPPAPAPPAQVTPAKRASGPATDHASAGASPSASAMELQTTGPRATATASGSSPGSSASPPGGAVRAYTLAGGDVTLDVTGGSVQLVTAVPDAGYAVETWSGTDWLRVDFNSGAKVSSLIASWYLHAPTITVTN